MGLVAGSMWIGCPGMPPLLSTVMSLRESGCLRSFPCGLYAGRSGFGRAGLGLRAGVGFAVPSGLHVQGRLVEVDLDVRAEYTALHLIFL